MIRLLTDEDFNWKIVRGLFRVRPRMDILRVQDVGLVQVPDPAVLAWAASNDRIVLTHDRQTMTGYATARVARGEPMPGLFVADSLTPIGRIVSDLLILDGASDHAEWSGQTIYIPL